MAPLVVAFAVSVHRTYSIDGLDLPVGERLDGQFPGDRLFEGSSQRKKWCPSIVEGE